MDLYISSSLCRWILPDGQTTDGADLQLHLHHTEPEHWGPPRMCPQPSALSLYTHDCTSKHSFKTTIKFADDSTIIGFITDGDELFYREEVRDLSSWCTANNLLLNVS